MTARTAEASTVPEPLGKPGGPGLFRIKGAGLPPYIQHVRNELIKQGRTESEATQMAIGIVRNWKDGHDGHGHRVSADVQAAAAKAIAEYDRLRAEAKAKPNKSDMSRTDLAQPRHPQSGRFMHTNEAASKAVTAMSDPLDNMDEDAIRNAYAKLPQVKPALRGRVKARLLARAKTLGISLSVVHQAPATMLANGIDYVQRTYHSGAYLPEGLTYVNLARTPMNLRQAARDKAKAAGETLPGTDSYPTQTHALFLKAVKAVGRGGTDHDRIRAYLIRRAKAEGWTADIPDNWNSDGSLKDGDM